MGPIPKSVKKLVMLASAWRNAGAVVPIRRANGLLELVVGRRAPQRNEALNGHAEVISSERVDPL